MKISLCVIQTTLKFKNSHLPAIMTIVHLIMHKRRSCGIL